MSPSTFVKRASIETASVLGVLALGGFWLAGASAGLGVLAGGALALGNLWWLARRAVAATHVDSPRDLPRRRLAERPSAQEAATPAPRWSMSVIFRLAALGALVALVLASGLAHPVGVVVGLTVLPCVLVARGLAAGREP